MTLIPRFLAAFSLLASLAPSVLANGANCKPHEFWYHNKSICVPNVAPNDSSSPPAGKSCPSPNSENWYWSNENSCCLPTSPPPPSNSPPTCQNGHSWNWEESCCFAPPSTPSGSGSSDDCSDDEFWYNPKSCCLPHGGPSNPPSPPTGSDCPPFGWYWGDFWNCCVPSHPSPPPPECPPGWEWISGSHKCQPIPTPPSQQPPQPSYGHGGHHWKKRNAQKLRVNNLCPNDLTACPIPGFHGLSTDYECIDTKNELQSCGGCSSTGGGQDCTSIRGAWNVGCEAGHCAVYNCMTGYKLASNGTTCIQL